MTERSRRIWLGWHKRGRRTYQAAILALWFAGFSILPLFFRWALELDLGRTLVKIPVTVVVAIILYFIAGKHWDKETQRAAATAETVRENS